MGSVWCFQTHFGIALLPLGLLSFTTVTPYSQDLDWSGNQIQPTIPLSFGFDRHALDRWARNRQVKMEAKPILTANDKKVKLQQKLEQKREDQARSVGFKNQELKAKASSSAGPHERVLPPPPPAPVRRGNSASRSRTPIARKMQYSIGSKKHPQRGGIGSKPDSDDLLPETQDYHGEVPAKPAGGSTWEVESSDSPGSKSSSSGSEAEVDSPDRKSQPVPKSWEQGGKPWISKLGPPILKSQLEYDHSGCPIFAPKGGTDHTSSRRYIMVFVPQLTGLSTVKAKVGEHVQIITVRELTPFIIDNQGQLISESIPILGEHGYLTTRDVTKILHHFGLNTFRSKDIHLFNAKFYTKETSIGPEIFPKKERLHDKSQILAGSCIVALLYVKDSYEDVADLITVETDKGATVRCHLLCKPRFLM